MKGGCEQRGNLCCGGDFLRHFFFPSTLQYVRDLVKCDSLETDLDQSPAHGCQKFVERERNGAGEGVVKLYCTLSLIDCAKLSGAKLSGMACRMHQFVKCKVFYVCVRQPSITLPILFAGLWLG